MKTKKAFTLLFLLPLFAFTAHKYYISLTQINYNTKTKSIELIVNVFIDDIQVALNKKYDKKFQLDSKWEIKNVDSYYKQYLNEHLQFKVDGKAVKYNYIGKEYDGNNVVFFYLEITNIQQVKNIEITNSILTAEFPRQQNLIKSKVNNIHKSVLLTKENDKGLLKY